MPFCFSPAIFPQRAPLPAPRPGRPQRLLRPPAAGARHRTSQTRLAVNWKQKTPRWSNLPEGQHRISRRARRLRPAAEDRSLPPPTFIQGPDSFLLLGAIGPGRLQWTARGESRELQFSTMFALGPSGRPSNKPGPPNPKPRILIICEAMGAASAYDASSPPPRA